MFVGGSVSLPSADRGDAADLPPVTSTNSSMSRLPIGYEPREGVRGDGYSRDGRDLGERTTVLLLQVGQCRRLYDQICRLLGKKGRHCHSDILRKK